MSEELTISKLADLPPDLDPLVQASLAEGFGFLERLREEWTSGANRFARPGEVVRFTEEGCEQLVAPSVRLQICSFLWVYYGYPASHYEGINV